VNKMKKMVACSSSPDDVPSLEVTPTAVVEEQPLDDEAKVMAFVECMRDEDMQLNACVTRTCN